MAVYSSLTSLIHKHTTALLPWVSVTASSWIGAVGGCRAKVRATARVRVRVRVRVGLG